MNNLRTIEHLLEAKLKLPVVVTQFGNTVAVLDRVASHAEVLSKYEVQEVLTSISDKNTHQTDSDSDLLQKLSCLQRRKYFHNKSNTSVKLHVPLPQLARADVIGALKRIASNATKISSLHVIIDTGPVNFEWDHVLEIVQILSQFRNKFKMDLTTFIDAPFSRPNESHMDFIVKHKVVLRYILGPSLGYNKNLGTKEAESLSAVSDYGLRVPVLFYWATEDGSFVAGTLLKALELNRASGVGLLPNFMSPFFTPHLASTWTDSAAGSSLFCDLYTMSPFSMFLAEPICDLEERISGCMTKHYFRAVVMETGQIVPFRSFPFAALYSNITATAKLQGAIPLLSNPNQLPILSQCRRCAWRHLCGGIDSNRSELTCRPYSTIAKVWCTWQKGCMRQIVEECFKIRGCMEHGVRR